MHVCKVAKNHERHIYFKSSQYRDGVNFSTIYFSGLTYLCRRHEYSAVYNRLFTPNADHNGRALQSRLRCKVSIVKRTWL